MEIFKSLAEMKNSQITTNVINENIYPEFNGNINITKGALAIEISWWCRVIPTYQMEQFTSVDDFDFESNDEKIVINGLEIDDITKFRQGLIDHGMKSVADSLTLSHNEIKDIVLKQLHNHKHYKTLFGNKKVFSVLSDDEMKIAFIEKMKEDIKFRETDHTMKRKLGWVKENGEGGVTTLTNAEILELNK